MLSGDHSNIDGPPLAVKCVIKFGSALGGEVTRARARVWGCTYTMCQERTSCMFYTCEVQTFNQERTHSTSPVGFNLRFGLVTLEDPGIDKKIMGVA